jgi:NAD-dependent SIR2 family protein deacetylase
LDRRRRMLRHFRETTDCLLTHGSAVRQSIRDQAHRARRALNDADVIVFIGTSFSVGITSTAIRSAEVSGARMVNVNLESAPEQGVLEVGAGAEVVLPHLAARVLA